MRRKRRSISDPESEISMTPMIDVVFQLLIYFLVTFTTPDVLAELSVARSEPKETNEHQPTQQVRVKVETSGFYLNGRQMSGERLGVMLNRLAVLDQHQTVLVICSRESTHDGLVGLLDLCAEAGLKNLSVMSTNE